MTDRELLELAAKAAGFKFDWFGEHLHIAIDERRWTVWNPLTDDGDALRLAVKLGFFVSVEDNFVTAITRQAHEITEEGCDLYAATRRAIVRAAAEIGKGMT